MCGLEMSRLHFENCVWALSTLISRVPARDRIGELERLVVSGTLRMWGLAAATLARLEDMRGFADLVEQTVRRWEASRTVQHRCASVVYFGYRFHRSEQGELLDRITEIAKDPRPQVRDTVVATVLSLLSKSERVDVLLPMVVDWSTERRSLRNKDGRRAIALDIGMFMLGLSDEARDADLDIDVLDLAATFPLECRYLLRRIMESPRHAGDVIDTMVDLAWWYPLLGVDRRATAALDNLILLARLLAPDLRRWRRRRAVAELGHRYPRRRRTLRFIFRTARRAERSQHTTLSGPRQA
jgi:hypothetical protein